MDSYLIFNRLTIENIFQKQKKNVKTFFHFIEEDKVEVVYQPSFIKEGEKLRINIPEHTSLEVMTYNINLEMYFSEFPFQPLDSFDSSIKPNQIKAY